MPSNAVIICSLVCNRIRVERLVPSVPIFQTPSTVLLVQVSIPTARTLEVKNVNTAPQSFLGSLEVAKFGMSYFALPLQIPCAV
jgi:hypothetical protein